MQSSGAVAVAGSASRPAEEFRVSFHRAEWSYAYYNSAGTLVTNIVIDFTWPLNSATVPVSAAAPQKSAP